MSSTATPFGLVPAFHPSGTIRLAVYSIRSGYATSILANGPVKIVPSSTGEGTIAAAAAGDRSIGAFQGVSWIDSDGVYRFSNKWTASTTGTSIQAWVSLDPAIIYNIQANATLDVDSIGKQYDWSADTGNTTVGISNVSLDVASAATNAGLQIVGLTPGPNNAWGDTYPIVQVRISEHQFVADVASF